jgi:hypothetical protein
VHLTDGVARIVEYSGRQLLRLLTPTIGSGTGPQVLCTEKGSSNTPALWLRGRESGWREALIQLDCGYGWHPLEKADSNVVSWNK